MPWPWIRRIIAERWHCAPWEVDDSPIGEVETELAIMQIEAECQPRG